VQPFGALLPGGGNRLATSTTPDILQNTSYSELPAYTLPLPLNPINYSTVFIPIHHSVVCELCVLMSCVYYSHNFWPCGCCFMCRLYRESPPIYSLVHIRIWTASSHFMLDFSPASSFYRLLLYTELIYSRLWSFRCAAPLTVGVAGAWPPTDF